MSQKILGIDLGTGSIGISLRNPDIQGTITEQLEYFSVDVFKSGVGMDKSGEYSFAANRTRNRQSRKLYDSRRRRLWETLRLLIEYRLCPLSKVSLEKWMKYDKSKGGYSHQYPIEDLTFESWIKMDFDNDGKPDYISPYHLRRELVQKGNQIDLDKQEDRYKLGRALYHIAQRRGFKSSKGSRATTDEEQREEHDVELSEELKVSELKKNRLLTEYMLEHNCATAACAFAELIDKGIRVRASQYEAVRSDYKQEIKTIFDIQNQLSLDSDLYKRLTSEKKGEGTIFYKKPLASQKKNVGKCTLEPNKPRCPISHPVYEEFRALSFVNNIRYRPDSCSEWKALTPEQAADIIQRLFMSRVKKTFKFVEIREYLEKELKQSFSKEKGTINYSDSVAVAGCPVTARLRNLLGENWKDFSIKGKKYRQNQAKADKSFHVVSHTTESIWNFCLNADEPEDIERFAFDCLGWDDKHAKLLIKLWDDMQQGYAMLSKKAMENINRFLHYGLRYSDAVLLAKIPDLLHKHGHDINDEEIRTIINEYISIRQKNSEEKTYSTIANALVSNYKALNYTERFADRDYDYTLQESDIKDIREKCKTHFGEKSWNSMPEVKRNGILKKVAQKYQDFFFDKKRDYIKAPKLSDDVFAFLIRSYSSLADEDRARIYHPSMISVYRPNSSDTQTDLLLGSPNMGSIKNPVALRTLNILQKKINNMLEKHLIDPEDTRIVIETTRRKGDVLDDANMRKAISHYQTERQNERDEIQKIIAQYDPKRNSEEDIDKALYVIEQYGHDNWEEPYLNNKGKKKGQFDMTYNKFIQKYELWLKQDCCCIYTGKVINIKNLFDDNCTDIEHTIPRSLSFDNSDMNLTVCDSYYNRHIKKNRIPTQLENYDRPAVIGGKTYSAIKPRLKKWEEKVEHLEDMANYWKRKSSIASTKEEKDFCIVNKHEWQMELDYWKNKLDRFTRTDVPDGFRNSQLVDTGIITRHAIAFLKSVFNNVVAEKGSVTADFRKILGLQSIEEKKDRSKHSHHAIDATVLTMIPVAGLREEILKLYYQKEEHLKLNQLQEADYYDRQLKEKIKQLYLGGSVSSVNDFIENNILINHRTNDRTLQNAKRKMRKHGKVVHIKDMNGLSKESVVNGDSIRLEISASGNLGAILLPDKDANGRYIKKNGKYQYSQDSNGQRLYTMVQRVDIKSFKKIEELDKIIDPVVRQSILTTIEQQAKIDSNKSIASILAGDIWIRDKKGTGDEIKANKKGKVLSPIRHVRCKVAAGRGYLKYESAIPLREQKYVSKKPLFNLTDRSHKKFVYAQSTGNYICLIYEGIFKGKVHREFVFLSNYETAKLKHYYIHEDKNCEKITTFVQFKSKLMNEPDFKKKTFKKNSITIDCRLTAILRNGDKLLKWNNSPEELYDLGKTELLKRLYIVTGFNAPAPSTNYIYVRKHIDTVSVKEEHYTSKQFQCLIEHRDFEITLTEQGDTIVFND